MIGDVIHRKLSEIYELKIDEYIAPKLRDQGLFELLVAVMLSQNTSDENAWKAYGNIVSKVGSITPEKVLSISVDELAELIKPAGMQYQRSRKIRDLATVFKSINPEQVVLDLISRGDYEEARRYLMSLPGVGPKTADVILLMKYGAPSFPVDTHITRITLRMGFITKRNYESIRRFWMENTTPKHYLSLHLLLITHGRKTCKARKPTCSSCVIREHCAMYLGRGK
ncbi:MAG: endonuclease III [Desulfurococcaceae archaeon]|jgi:endonuclease-3